MTTIANAIGRIRRDLRRSYKEPVNVLSTAISTTSATSFTMLRELNTLVPDSVVEVGDELLYVISTDTSLKQVTNCIRGFDGTTAATAAIGATVRPNPRFSAADIRQSMIEELQSWVPRVYRVGSQTIAVADGSNVRAWDLTGTGWAGGLISAKLQPSSGTDFRPLDILYHSIEGGQDTTKFASGFAYVLKHEGLPSGTLTVRYARTFDTSVFTDATDLQTTVGIPSSCDDVLRFGVLWRLLSTQEAQRSDRGMQDEPRRADEVKAGDAIRSAAAYKSLRDERMTEEAEKLAALYGMPSW